MSDNATDTAATKVGTAAKSQSSNALIVQNYALSVQAQPSVDLSGTVNLAKYQTGINTALGKAKDSATLYLDTTLPKAIVTIANIDAYFQTQNALAQALAPNTDAQTAIALLKAVQEQAVDFKRDASAVTTDLQSLRGQFSSSSADLNQFARDLAIAVDGDNGVLSEISNELSSIDSKIDGCIAGIVLSGLAIVGGVIMIGVGALAEAVTGGLATALVVGGIAVTVAGIGGEVGSSVALAGLLDAKSDLLTTRSRLNAETTLAAGLGSGLNSLSTSAANAATAAQGMANAWGLLGDDLDSLVTALINGQTTSNALRLLFATAAQGDVKTVQGDVVVIRGQLAGVQTTVNPSLTASQVVREQIAAAQNA
jgi:non-hemolytic enterotoxin B/C